MKTGRKRGYGVEYKHFQTQDMKKSHCVIAKTTHSTEKSISVLFFMLHTLTT